MGWHACTGPKWKPYTISKSSPWQQVPAACYLRPSYSLRPWKQAWPTLSCVFQGSEKQDTTCLPFIRQKSSFSLVSVVDVHKDNELLPLLQHVLRSDWLANPPLGSEGGAGGGGVSRGTCSVTVQSATATSLQSIPVIVSSPTNAPSSGWDDKQLINLPNARKMRLKLG